MAEALESLGHISQELAPFPHCGRLPGLQRASPSTPLDVSSYVGHLSKCFGSAQGAGRLHCRANSDADDDDDRRAAKYRCRTCPSHASGARRGHAAGSSHVRPSLSAPTSRSSSSLRRRPACAGSTSSARGRPIATWLEEHFDFHPLDYEDVYSRNQRPKLDQYDDYLFIVLHFPAYEKTVGRLNAAELDLFVGPDYLITLPNDAAPAARVRCSSAAASGRTCASRPSPRAPATCSTRSSTTCVDASFPMLRKMGIKLDRLEDDIFEGALVARSSATSRT